MTKISEELEKVVKTPQHAVKDAKKLQQQQSYYKKLADSGVAKKQQYNLRPISSI